MDIDPFLTVSTSNFCNKSLLFQDANEEKLFYHNKKKIKTYKDGFYFKNPIDYTINKFGYRCNHVLPPDTDYILALGCSHTFGHSLHKEHRYTDLLESHYNIPVLNLGVSGGSCNLIKDNLLQLLNSGYRLPKIVILQWPNKLRLFYGTTRLQSTDLKQATETMESLQQYSETSQCQTYWLLAKHNISFVDFSIFDPSNADDIFYIDVARDFDHPGIDSNIKIFKYIKERIDGI
jgi:hypothetical protein